jgi:pimeloyl-ACP methyl ester carboxylesterase
MHEMEGLDLPEGVNPQVVGTSRLETHVLSSGPEDGVPVVFIHGNASSSRFFDETLAALASLPRYRGLAPDLRGSSSTLSKNTREASSGWIGQRALHA